MHHEPGNAMAARAALCGQLATLQAAAERVTPLTLAGEIEALRRTAASHGLVAAERVARAFTRRLSEARCRNAFTPWFAALGDAIGCESADEHAVAEACLAHLAVRHG
jgi:hypothetical protein